MKLFPRGLVPVALGSAMGSKYCDADEDEDDDDDDDSPDKNRPFLVFGAEECPLFFPPKFTEFVLLLLVEELWRVFRERERELSFRFLPFGGLPRLPEDDEPLLPLNDIQIPRVTKIRHEERGRENEKKFQPLDAVTTQFSLLFGTKFSSTIFSPSICCFNFSQAANLSRDLSFSRSKVALMSLQRQSFAVLRQLRLCGGIRGCSGLLKGGEKYPQTQPRSLFSATGPHLPATSVCKRPFSLSPSPRFHRYLSTSSGEGAEEELKWYDIDTPEFARIVASYEAGTKAADVSLIDVRQPEELSESGKVPGTINIPRK